MSTVTACRSCGDSDLRVFLSLGHTPLANALRDEQELTQPEATYPLALALCTGCSLVQITETVPPEDMFRNYVYFSSYSDTMLRHSQDIAERQIRLRGLGAESLVLEIASNDGYLLQNFVRNEVPVLGIEPARNVARVARERGIPTVDEFFSQELAAKLVSDGVRADLILANNVMAHVPDINGVVAGIKTLLKPSGAFVMETPYLGDLISGLEFDTIYHEHIFYYSLAPLERLFRRHGLAVADVEHIPIHGGSLRVTVVHEGHEGDRPTVREFLGKETEWGVDRLEYYREFSAQVARLGEDLRGLLGRLKAEGKRLAAYGAAAKGSTLLNALGIGRQWLDFVADRSPHKQSRFMPGVRLPIVAPEQLVSAMPDYVLLLTWNFADEILAQQAKYRERGGRFIIPVPQPVIV